MPAESDAQQRFMGLCAHNPQHAKGECPSHKVAEEFSHKPDHEIPERKGDDDEKDEKDEKKSEQPGSLTKTGDPWGTMPRLGMQKSK